MITKSEKRILRLEITKVTAGDRMTTWPAGTVVDAIRSIGEYVDLVDPISDRVITSIMQSEVSEYTLQFSPAYVVKED